MRVRDTARKQQQQTVDSAAGQLQGIRTPPKGWLATLRGALGMSGADVARRLRLSRNAVHQAERNEREGAITLNQLRKIAESMGGQLVYAVIPTQPTAQLISDQARKKAESVVVTAGEHMALEQQGLPDNATHQRIEELARQLASEMPPGFWNDTVPSRVLLD